MNRLVCKLRSAMPAKICLAAAAYFCFASSPAQAGCDDHVVVLAHLSPQQRSLFIRMMIGRSCGQALPGDAAPACASCPFAPLGNGPCRGPYCSNERLPEGAPVSPAPTRGLDPWSLLVHVVKLQEINFVGYVSLPVNPAPIERVDSIFHPPRAA
jgi:hypothetical protein